MAGISNAVLVQSIREILKGADLSSLSAKKVRRKLEEKFGADLTDRKKEIDKILMKLISEEEDEDEQSEGESEEQQEEEGGSSDDDDDDDDKGGRKHRSKKNSASNGLSDQSVDEDEDQEEEGHSDRSQSEDSRPASPPQKKSKSHSSKSKKEKHGKSLHGDKKNDSEMNDEQLAKKLQEEENNFRSRPRSVKRVPAAPKKERKPPKEGKARVSIYSKPCLLSGELASVMGTDKMARKDVVKRMWEIVRERKLEDPKNKQFMLCDEQLQRVFGRKRVRTFGMMKHLKSHIKDAVD